MSDSELLARVDERVKSIHEDIGQFAEELRTHGKRLSSLEKKQSWIIGVGSAIVAFMTALIRYTDE